MKKLLVALSALLVCYLAWDDLVLLVTSVKFWLGSAFFFGNLHVPSPPHPAFLYARGSMLSSRHSDRYAQTFSFVRPASADCSVEYFTPDCLLAVAIVMPRLSSSRRIISSGVIVSSIIYKLFTGSLLYAISNGCTVATFVL